MQKIYNAFALTFLSTVAVFSAQAQIPNPSFESWTSGQPDGWYLSPIGVNNFGTQSNNAHNGASAVKMEVLDIGGGNLFTGAVTTGDANHTRYGCNCRPEALHFWYILHPVNGEQIFVDLAATNIGMTEFGAGSAFIDDSNNVYKEFILPITYNTANNLDSMSLGFLLHGTTVAPQFHLGAYFILDDLSFGSATGIDGEATMQAGLESIAPNPASSETRMIYRLNETSFVRLAVYDALGRKVLEVVNEKQTAGRYKAMPDVSQLPNGVYTARLEANGMVESKTFAVAR